MCYSYSTEARARQRSAAGWPSILLLHIEDVRSWTGGHCCRHEYRKCCSSPPTHGEKTRSTILTMFSFEQYTTKKVWSSEKKTIVRMEQTEICQLSLQTPLVKPGAYNSFLTHEECLVQLSMLCSSNGPAEVSTFHKYVTICTEQECNRVWTTRTGPAIQRLLQNLSVLQLLVLSDLTSHPSHHPH